MSEQLPSYYQKYLALGEKEMDMAFFLDLFERFNGKEWEKFLLDLLLEEPYPDKMMKYRKGFSALAYYSGVLSSLPNMVKKEVENALLKIALPLLSDRTGDAEKILLRQLDLAKFMTRGLPVSIIVDHLLAPEETNPLLKTRAAMTLAFYKEEEAERFWRFEAKKRLASQSILAIPRFLALKEKDMLDSLESLIYAEPAENISRLEWNYHFEKIIEVFSLEKDQWGRLNSVYQRLPSWIKTIFNESLAASEEEEYLQLSAYLHSNGFTQEDRTREGAPPQLLMPDHLLTPIYIAEVDGLRPFDQDYFIDYAEQLDFFRVHGFRLVREKYKDYPHSLEVLNKKEIAILPRPRSFLTTAFKAHVREDNMSIAIINFYTGSSLAGPADIHTGAPDKKDMRAWLDRLLGQILKDRMVRVLEPASLDFMDNFVTDHLPVKLGLGSYNVQTYYGRKSTELSLFSFLQKGSFILTTAPLYALARANKYQIYLTPRDIVGLINMYLDGEQRKKTIREFYATGLHNQLIINRRPKHPEDDAVIMKLARISLSTSEHIALHPRRFTQFIADRWKNDKMMSKYHIDADSILEAMDVSYKFQSMENYLHTYFEQSLQRYDGDSMDMRSIFEQVIRERSDIEEVETSIMHLLEDHSGTLTAEAKEAFDEQQKISDFCLKSGAYELARKAQTRKKELLLNTK